MHFKYSDFDSACLGRKIATASVPRLDLSLLRTLRTELAELKCDLGFLKAETLPRGLMAQGLCTLGLEIADIKLEFERKLTGSEIASTPSLDPSEFRIDVQLESVEFARNTLHEVADRSRFNTYFGAERSRALYDRWLENLRTDGKQVRWAVVTHLPTRSCAGIIAARLEATGAHWEMVGVSQAFRGRGLGRKMANHLVNQHLAEGIIGVRVGTQIDNQEAADFYQKVGFHLSKSLYQFHLKSQLEK